MYVFVLLINFGLRILRYKFIIISMMFIQLLFVTTDLANSLQLCFKTVG